MTTPTIGQKITVAFRTDGNCKRIKTAPVLLKVIAVYTDKDQYGNPAVKLENGDKMYVQLTDKGWQAVS